MEKQDFFQMGGYFHNNMVIFKGIYIHKNGVIYRRIDE